MNVRAARLAVDEAQSDHGAAYAAYVDAIAAHQAGEMDDAALGSVRAAHQIAADAWAKAEADYAGVFATVKAMRRPSRRAA